MNTLSLFWSFLKLGFTSFGGPVAHIGFFRQQFVERQAWFSESQFAQWIALCHMLPGPSSSQLGFLIGYQRGGWSGAMAAFIGFTFPSALIMALLAYGWFAYHQAWSSLLHGLILVAAAVVIQAIWAMGKQFCSTWTLRLLALCSALAFLVLPYAWTPIALIAVLFVIGQFMPSAQTENQAMVSLRTPSKSLGYGLIALVIALLALLPGLVMIKPEWAMFDSLYRAGALVFGGGHVVLPYLHLELVQPGLVSEQAFLSGYSLAQALPGPMFSFAAYLGALSLGWQGAVIATLAVFLAGLLLIIAILPFYQSFAHNPKLQKGLVAIQAGVVGFLLAALVNPILPHALINWQSALLIALNLMALLRFKISVLWLLPLNAAIYSLITWA